jgi:hypothetical protein
MSNQRISTAIIREMKPCEDRWNNYLEHYNDFDGTVDEFLALDKITFKDKVWVCVRLLDHKQKVKFAVDCAKSVLHIFEEKYPEDKRPRLAIEAAEAWLKDPSEENRNKCINAAYAAAAAYYAAAAAADAAYADYAVTDAAAAASAAYAAKKGENEQELIGFLRKAFEYE